ncbi:MAG: His-Xaa-Ser system protein HxsD [Elusimicrobia bacterium RBG_16_66_12]|nr:MAG: His-Xaa-Ser system protein HxsD [Elusimicrobia bacterium RBG_16_66_12]
MMTKQSKETQITVDLSVYPLEAVQAAAYSLTDRLIVRIARDGKGSVSVVLKPKSGGDLEALAGRFHNELLHESLRLQVSQANQKIREYIVTKALVSAQVPSAVPPMAASESAPAAQGACPECETQQSQAAPPPVDADLEKEIEKLLAEIEKGDGADDPLGVAVPWEEKYGGKADKAAPPIPAEPSKSKTAKPRAA